MAALLLDTLNAITVPDRLIALPEVIRLTGLRKTSIYTHMRSGTFPQRVRFGSAVRWHEQEVRAWIAALERLG